MSEEGKAGTASYGSSVDEAQAMFNRQLATYRKIVSANCMYHREVYDILRDTLALHMTGPFSFLDIACGDASASAATSERHSHQQLSWHRSFRAITQDRKGVSSKSCRARLTCIVSTSPRP